MAAPVEPLTPQLEEIPDKLYFRIGEVSRLTGVKQYVLRFWESEFPGLGPKKSGTGHRLYRRKDVEMVLEIKRLLYDKRFTIEGARKWLESRPKSMTSSKSKAGKRQKPPPPHSQHPDAAQPGNQEQTEMFPEILGAPATAVNLDPIRRELRAILELLR